MLDDFLQKNLSVVTFQFLACNVDECALANLTRDYALPSQLVVRPKHRIHAYTEVPGDLPNRGELVAFNCAGLYEKVRLISPETARRYAYLGNGY